MEITGLTPSAEYVYRVGDGGSFMSEEKSFTAPKSASDKNFKVIFYSDPQSESVENYMSFKDSIDQALKICPNPDLMISAEMCIRDRSITCGASVCRTTRTS